MTTPLKLGGDGKNIAHPLGARIFTLMDLSNKSKFSSSGLFGMALREGRFSTSRHETLAKGTVRGTFSHAVQAFWTKGRPNTTKDYNHKLSLLLLRQFRAFQNEVPKEKQQKALPFSVLDKLGKQQVTELDRVITQFIIGAAFFACCSCKYSKVP